MPARSNFRILQFLPIVAARRHAPPNRARIEPPVSPPRGYSRLRPASLGRTILGFASVPPLRTFLPSARTSPVRGTPPPARPPAPPSPRSRCQPRRPFDYRDYRSSVSARRASATCRRKRRECRGIAVIRSICGKSPLNYRRPLSFLFSAGRRRGGGGGEGGRDGRLVRVINFRLVIARPWLAPG